MKARLVLALLLATGAARANPALSFHEAGRTSKERSERPNVGAAALDSRTWIGLEGHYLRAYEPGPRSALLVGGSLELPVMLFIRGGNLGQGRLGAEGAWEEPISGPLRVLGGLETRIATAHGIMGEKVAWDAALTGVLGLRFRHVSFGGSFQVQQGLSTLVLHSDYVKSAYEDRYEDGLPDHGGPKDGFVAFPFRRFYYGVLFGADLGTRFGMFASLELITTHTSYDAGLFDTLMFGLWPFYASLGGSARF